MQRFYGLQLAHVLTGEISWRRFKVLAMNLPRESVFIKQLSPATQWGTQDYLLALLVDQGNYALWQRGGGKGGKPKPIKRPVEPPKQGKRFGSVSMSVEDMKQRMDARNRGGDDGG